MLFRSSSYDSVILALHTVNALGDERKKAFMEILERVSPQMLHLRQIKPVKFKNDSRFMLDLPYFHEMCKLVDDITLQNQRISWDFVCKFEPHHKIRLEYCEILISVPTLPRKVEINHAYIDNAGTRITLVDCKIFNKPMGGDLPLSV
jgi:hypothetical protein